MQTEFQIEVYQSQLAEFCRKWRIIEVALFGSVLGQDFRPDSDVDLLVTFDPEARWSLFDLVRMEDGLKEIFGREVDLVERKSIEKSENYIRRKSILRNLEVIYAAG